MLVLGAKEAEAGNISVRDRKGETTTMELDAFIADVYKRQGHDGARCRAAASGTAGRGAAGPQR